MSLTVLVLLAITAANAVAEVKYYPPISSNVNNLEFALNGTSAPGIYNSSKTPDSIYGMYNWCNMPHIRAREYKKASSEYKLEYVEVIQRHHKRTPYGSNTFFKEDVTWDCTNSGPIFFGKSDKPKAASEVTQIQWQGDRDAQNPWMNTIGPGFVGSNCQFPQITPEGLEDSHIHGADIRSVYVDKLHFLESSYDAKHVQFRVTNNVITSQVAGALVKGLFPTSQLVEALIQPSGLDSLEPQYPCPKSSNIKNDYTTNSKNWTVHLDRVTALYDKLDKVSGIAQQDTAGWHTSLDHYYDNMSAKQCHGKNLPCSVNDTNTCVTQAEADTVYRLGNWEYSYMYRDAPQSALYGALRFGAWMLELRSHLQSKVEGKNPIRYLHNVAHDGSMSALLAFLQIETMVWPGMGSEVVFELYSSKKSYFVRVLWSGQVMKTSTPLGALDMVPLEKFIEYIDTAVGSGSELLASCAA